MKDLICKAKAKYYQDKVEQCEGDQKKLFEIVDSLLGRGKCKSLPPYEDALSLAEAFSEFFITVTGRPPGPRRPLLKTCYNIFTRERQD